jgi:hypothetical protein
MAGSFPSASPELSLFSSSLVWLILEGMLLFTPSFSPSFPPRSNAVPGREGADEGVGEKEEGELKDKGTQATSTLQAAESTAASTP